MTETNLNPSSCIPHLALYCAFSISYSRITLDALISTKMKAGSAGQTLGAFLHSNCYLDLLLIVILQKKVEPLACIICGKVLRLTQQDIGCPATYETSAKFVPLFSNSFIVTRIQVDTYVKGNSHVLGKAVISLSRIRI